jgi:hypothetical protein
MLSKHHAYVAYGSPSQVKEFASFIAKEIGVTAAHNPDFHIRDYSKSGNEDSSAFGIDDAASLISLALQKSTGGIKVFIIAANALTREAQNALLKTLEEPAENTVFAFLVPKGALIDTVLSRTMVISWEGKSNDATLAIEFLKSSAADRTKLLAGMLKDKDKESARDFLDSLERVLSPMMQKTAIREALSEIYKMRSYIMDRSPSLKMILEQLSLVLPQYK